LKRCTDLATYLLPTCGSRGAALRSVVVAGALIEAECKFLPKSLPLFLANTRRRRYLDLMSLRTCRVSCRDLKGVEHAIEVTADSLYEAVAQALRVFRGSDWVDDLGHGRTTISVIVKNPEVEHKVRVQDFERWLEASPRSPAEMILKNRLRELLTKGG
jgi:hypothetical protein